MVVTRLQFSQLFSQAWVKAISPATIINGFRKTGVCPLNSEAIEIVVDPSSESSTQSSEGSPSGNNEQDESPLPNRSPPCVVPDSSPPSVNVPNTSPPSVIDLPLSSRGSSSSCLYPM